MHSSNILGADQPPMHQDSSSSSPSLIKKIFLGSSVGALLALGSYSILNLKTGLSLTTLLGGDADDVMVDEDMVFSEYL